MARRYDIIVGNWDRPDPSSSYRLFDRDEDSEKGKGRMWGDKQANKYIKERRKQPSSGRKQVKPTRTARMIAARTASIVLVPVTTAAGYVTYVRSTAQPTPAHSHIMTLNGADARGREQWRKMNNGIGLVDVGRSCGGV